MAQQHKREVSYPVYRKPKQLDHLDEGTFDPVRCLLYFFALFDVGALHPIEDEYDKGM